MRLPEEVSKKREVTSSPVAEGSRLKGYEKLFTFVRADNMAAPATYLHQGFRVVGTAQRQARVNGKYLDEIMIEMFL